MFTAFTGFQEFIRVCIFNYFCLSAADEPGHASVRKLIEAIKAKTAAEGLLSLLDEIPQTEKSYFMLTNDEGLSYSSHVNNISLSQLPELFNWFSFSATFKTGRFDILSKQKCNSPLLRAREPPMLLILIPD